MAKFKSSAKPGARSSSTSSSDERANAEGMSRSILDSAQQIWLAGMGAFARAQEEGGKLFDTLVREGSTLERRTRSMATDRVDAVRGVVETGVDQVRERAVDTWDRLEKVFEDRVQRALNGLGVPGREEIEALTRRVEALTAEVRKLGGSAAPRAPRTSQATHPASARTAKPKAPAAPRTAAAKKRRSTSKASKPSGS